MSIQKTCRIWCNQTHTFWSKNVPKLLIKWGKLGERKESYPQVINRNWKLSKINGFVPKKVAKKSKKIG